MPNAHKTVKVIPITLSDHFMLYSTIQMKYVQLKHKEITFRDYKRFDTENFIEEIKSVFNNDTFTGINCVESIWSSFKLAFNKVCDKHAPIRTFRVKDRFNPWMDQEILNLMYERDNLHSKARKTDDTNLWTQYRQMRNKVTSMIREAKKNFFTEQINLIGNNRTKFWKIIRRIMPSKHNDHIPDITPEEFNNHFVNVGIDINSRFPKDMMPTMKSPKSIYSLKLKMVPESQVLSYILQIPHLKSSLDLLNMDQKLIVLSAKYIAPIIAKIINLSIVTAIIPTDFKLSRVSPVYKNKGPTTCLKNYRPISVNCHLAKIMEKQILIQMMDYLLKHDMITPDQSAYLSKHSSVTSLHKVIDD